MITEFISQYVSVTNLGAIASLFIGVLLPVAILLLETVTDNVIDRAVILKEVVNLKIVLIGLGLIALCFLSWGITLIRPVSFVLFLVGFVILIMPLLRAVSWISDWNESYPDGVRYKWRKKILSDKTIDVSKRLRLWEVYLDSFKKQSRDHAELLTNFVTGEQFLDFFKSYYADVRIDKFKLLSSTSRYTEIILSYPGNYNAEFLKFWLNEWTKLRNDEEHPDVLLAWENLIRKDCHLSASDDLKTDAFLSVVEEMTPNEQTEENGEVYEKMAQLICDLIWERNRKSRDEELLKNSVWRISSDHLSLDKSQRTAQSFLLDAFWVKVSEIESKRATGHDLADYGFRLDSLVNVLFSNADPITLGRLYELFQEIFNVSYIHSYGNDYNKRLFKMLNRRPIFGYASRIVTTWPPLRKNNEEVDIDSFYKQEKESIEIAIKSLRLFSDDTRTEAYCGGLLKTLNSSAFSELVKGTDSNISLDLVEAWKDLITKVMSRLHKGE